MSSKIEDELVRDNLKLVYFIANKYRNRGIEYEDLICAGSIGLYRAAKKFDASKSLNGKFGCYAGFWIRSEIMRTISTQSRMISIPENKIGKIKENVFVSLEKTFDTDEKQNKLEDFLADDKYNTEEDYLKRESVREIKAALKTLPEKYALVLSKRYGLIDGKEESLRDVGLELNLSKERVRQIEAAAMNRLREGAVGESLRELAA
ncbi:MAG: sigma-70 family RNA polymerase sigma factor [Treponema sp.]